MIHTDLTMDEFGPDLYCEGAVYGSSGFSYDQVREMLAHFGKIVRDKTLEWASENARLHYDEDGSISLLDNLDDNVSTCTVSKETILEGKIHKDLEI